MLLGPVVKNDAKETGQAKVQLNNSRQKPTKIITNELFTYFRWDVKKVITRKC